MGAQAVDTSTRQLTQIYRHIRWQVNKYTFPYTDGVGTIQCLPSDIIIAL